MVESWQNDPTYLTTGHYLRGRWPLHPPRIYMIEGVDERSSLLPWQHHTCYEAPRLQHTTRRYLKRMTPGYRASQYESLFLPY
jgi:hypothetical protein